MSSLILPATVQANIERERVSEKFEALRWFEYQLRQLDPKLSLVRVSGRAEVYGVIPGYWHIVRDNSDSGEPDSYMPLKGEHGEPVEPDSGVLERLRAADLQRPGAIEDMRRRLDREEAASAAQAQAGRDERQAAIADHIRHLTVPSIRVTRSL